MDHTFVQNTAPSVIVLISGLDRRTLYQIKCLNFEKWGHYDIQCPEPMLYKTPNKAGINLAQIVRCIEQDSSGGTVRNKWILLDSCSTISSAKNDSIVSKVTVIPS